MLAAAGGSTSVPLLLQQPDVLVSVQASVDAAPAPRLLRSGRCLHVIDVENLNMGPSVDYTPVARLWEQIAYPSSDDLVVCGSDVTGVFAVNAAFPSARRVVGRGANGADRALGDVLTETHIGGRFDTLILGSGDGYFAPLVLSLRWAGVHTVVVGRKGRTARQLHRVAHRTLELA